MGLETLPVFGLAESDDCTDCCVWKRFQSLVYLRVTTVQTDGSGNAFSLLFT
ncbi:hypothetical protein DPMN_080612 [Dreissena polymorpha]|uniref:Uncharacterized protein n=1 Tax=Dreissena polymorpha TaxID=45954 RepID=A0A9D3YUV8_DREPO|nr:hypothetical protein DPMN_080612 [Dreissena polymorpha]